jgi:hypothetical protein
MPTAVAVDKSGNVYISDRGANRVLKYDNPFAAGGGRSGTPGHSGDTTADLVIGQGSSGKDFLASACQSLSDPNFLCSPGGLALDPRGNLYVADITVREYFRPASPSGNGAKAPGHPGDVTADVFFGARGFDQNGKCVNGPDCVYGALAVALDRSGDLFVADADGSRVFEYLNPAAAGGGTPGAPGSAGDTTADLVWGQGGSFTSNTCNGSAQMFVPEGAATATDLCLPSGVALDSLGNLYVSDTRNHRVLAFDSMAMGGSLTVSPTSIDFGTVAQNTTKPRSVTLKNVGSSKIRLAIGIASESTSSPFAVKKQCAQTLRPGRTCNVTVTFTPTDTMPHTGTLLINDNVAGAPQKVPLAGTGRAP